ncbi:MAG TPA: cystathionine gamma-synthase family protein [Polyangiaceae bacterium]|jgi:methionine-gamma-lyase|nr:cystathionine gamma-synthase family protein [Polyangiaceae bacterium]
MRRRHSKGGKEFDPETLALGYGYDPFLSEGAVKPPVFLTSTFQFKNAEAGKSYFEIAYGLRAQRNSEAPGLIYSRLNNPNLEIFENRLAAWDGTESGAVFASGMAATSTTFLSLLEPGDVILSTAPVYGGTHYLFEHILPKFGIKTRQVQAGSTTAELMRAAAQEAGPERVKALFLETPANPSNELVDIAACVRVAEELRQAHGRRVLTIVDNTLLGPVFQRPAKFGADLVLYSATKFIGGHSDLIAGVVTGGKALLDQLKVYRTILGTMTNPFTGWLLLRSLETVSIRMRRQAKTARRIAKLLTEHPKVQRVYYPGLLEEGSAQHAIYERQCTGPGSLIAFEVHGGQPAAFRVLNNFEVFRLAVSLGGTESLVEHPMTMTHADVPPEQLELHGVSAGLIRMSVGIEHSSDLERDLECALEEA